MLTRIYGTAFEKKSELEEYLNALEEAKNIIAQGWNPERAIGAVQLCSYLCGEKTYDECVTDWINKTNQYAKRQRTWFRTQFTPDVIVDTVGSDADVNKFI